MYVYTIITSSIMGACIYFESLFVMPICAVVKGASHKSNINIV